MDEMSTFWMLCCSALVVLGLIGLTIRLDPAERARRRRHEVYVRRATVALIQEAERARRPHVR